MKKKLLKLNQLMVTKSIKLVIKLILSLMLFSDIEDAENNDSPESPEIISVSSSPGKDNEVVREESPVAGPSGVTSDSSVNERKPITWDESP